MSDWETIKFGSLYEIPSRNGLMRPRRVRGEGYKMVNMGEIFAHDRIDNPDMELVPMDEREKRVYSLEKGDLLFARQSMVEAGAGKCSIMLNVPEITTFESHIIRVRLNKAVANPLFYYYYFVSPIGQGNVQTIVTGAAQKGIRGSDLQRLEVPFPDLQTQEEIADVIGKYDDLIANNERRIALLEEAMHLLYREWFVHLRFPGWEETAVVDGVPEGWEKRPLEEVAYFNYGKSLPKRDRVEGDVPVYGSSGIVGTHNESLVEGPVIIIGRKGNVGTVFWSPVPCFPIDTVFYISPEQTSLFIYHNLQYQNFLNTDAAVPGLNRNYAHSLPVLMPDPDTYAEFERHVTTAYRQIKNLKNQNVKLREARDALLPRLMSGRLEL